MHAILFFCLHTIQYTHARYMFLLVEKHNLQLKTKQNHQNIQEKLKKEIRLYF